MYRILGLFFLLYSGALAGQNLSIDKFELQGDTVHIDFKISKKFSDRELYNVYVFSSKDDFNTPLGVKMESAPTDSLLHLEFDGLEQIGVFTGNIQFRLKAVAAHFPVVLDSLENDILRKGKSFNLTWTDFHESGWYDIDLCQNGEVVENLISHHRGTSFESKLPKHLEKGQYEIQVTPSNNASLHSELLPVTVKNTSKLYFLLGGLLAGGGYFVLTQSEAGGGSTGDGGTGLPDPPDPPTN